MEIQGPAADTVITPPPPPPRIESLKERIEIAIASEEAMQEKLLAEAQAHERKVHMLKALLPLYPPATSTLPEGSSVAVCKSRAVPRLPVAVHVAAAGSYSSALLK